MVVETFSDKEVAVGTCEMAPDMFQEVIAITKENVAKPNADAATAIKAALDAKYGGNWLAIVGEGYGLFFAHQAENSPIFSLERLSQLSCSRQTKDGYGNKKSLFSNMYQVLKLNCYIKLE